MALTDPNYGDARAYSIVVVGNDIYVAGQESNGSSNRAKYWKNRQPIALTDGTKNASANSITIVGNDVYVAGFDNGDGGAGVRTATYWKNGEPIALTDGTKNAEARSIVVIER